MVIEVDTNRVFESLVNSRKRYAGIVVPSVYTILKIFLEFLHFESMMMTRKKVRKICLTIFTLCTEIRLSKFLLIFFAGIILNCFSAAATTTSNSNTNVEQFTS